VYGVTGSTSIDVVAAALRDGHSLMGLGMALVLAGLGFKIAAVPFHMWVPDSYEAASTPFVAWLAVAPKAAGFIVIFRLYEIVGMHDALTTDTWPLAVLWVGVMSALAAI